LNPRFKFSLHPGGFFPGDFRKDVWTFFAFGHNFQPVQESSILSLLQIPTAVDTGSVTVKFTEA
jgi:hypothetical protein